MKPGAPSLRDIERLGELARLAREGAAPVATTEGLDAAWELQSMDADDRAQLEAVMREMERQRPPVGQQQDVLREWETLQAGLAGPVAAPQRPREYTFQLDNPFMDSANPFHEGVALYGAGNTRHAWCACILRC